ncbi:hypothetical protein E2562_021757 [Oryza meyeriana var. granulata]|uniref:Uncharacterized protein n=1 Tax=Oryza meyeriana var. granulata TaxID=110450 RepID=A0A6G1EXY7_9ORYZ|nr:hypothetical protein E2562_021757 [Oryza meyeriana var. granulata]
MEAGISALGSVLTRKQKFASTELVNPSQFQRVGFNDCLVKGGGPLGPSQAVSFQYSNSFGYPLVVSNVACK